MKKIFTTILLTSMLVLTGCREKTIVGEELVNKAREDYAKLDSAAVVITDMKTGEVTQTFSFNYKDDGTMVYLYNGYIDGKPYIEYNDGESLYIENNGQITSSNNKSRDFKKFTRKKPHPDASKEFMLLIKGSIDESLTKATESGKQVTYIYNAKKFCKVNRHLGKIKAFSVIYNFDRDGKFLNFIDTCIIEEDGKDVEKAFKAEITEKNHILRIDKPEIF